MDRSLSKTEILRGHGSFTKVFKNSRVYTSKYFKIYVSNSIQENSNEKNFSPLLPKIKVGFIVSKKKVKSAVKRNYLKRIMKEVFRIKKGLLEGKSFDSFLMTFNDEHLNLINRTSEKIPLSDLYNDFEFITSKIKDNIRK